MFLILITAVSVFFSLWFYIRWSKVKRYWKEKSVPFSPPHPIFGNLTFLLRENPAIWMRQLYKDFQTPYVGIWLFWRPALVINDPEIGRNILIKDSDNFRNRMLSSGKTDPIGGLNLFTVNDPIWTPLRRRLTSVFTAAKLRNQSSIHLTKTKDLVQRIREETAKDNYFNLRRLCTDYTTDVIGESAFGIISESAKTGHSLMRDVAAEFTHFSLIRGISWSSIFFWPELVDIFRLSFFPKDTIERVRLIFRSVIQQRGGFDKKIKDPKDLLDALIKMKQEAALENEEMSEDFLLAQGAVFLLGGFDTSASIMSRVLYQLAWSPRDQEKVYEEILKVKKETDTTDLDPSVLPELTYMTCVIKEVLRFFPPMGWLDRIADKDYKIDENLTIPAGTPVYVNSVAMQLDPQYFPDPMVFKPERFLPENEKDITPYTFMPFGEGPRMCIGKRFAYNTLKQALSSIILNFELRPLPNTPEPIDIRTEKNGLFYMPLDERMKVQFVPRKTA